jgi:hypothetical protein
VSKRAKTLEADVRLNFEMWKAARDIATSCDDRMKESEVTHPPALHSFTSPIH